MLAFGRVSGEQETGLAHRISTEVLFPNLLLSLYAVVGSSFLTPRRTCIDVSFSLMLQILWYFLFFPRKLGMALILKKWRSFFSWGVSVGGE